MKASELIEELRKIIETWGDWPVEVESSELITVRTISANGGNAKKIVIE